MECKGPMDSELLPFSVLVNMSVLLLLWLWSLALGSLFSNRHSCSGEVRFRDISWVSWKYPGFIYRGIKGKKSRFALSCSDCTESKEKTQHSLSQQAHSSHSHPLQGDISQHLRHRHQRKQGEGALKAMIYQVNI